MTSQQQNKLPNNMSPREALSWHLDMGVDEVIANEAINHFTTPPAQKLKTQTPEVSSEGKTQTQTNPSPEPVKRTPRKVLTLSAKEGAVLAANLASEAKTLVELKAAIEKFEGCGLIRTAMNTVFSDGCADADLMIIGDAPNADEDKAGKPFAGEAGELLDKMMAAIDLKREDGFYLSNIIPWRPPGNRKPSVDETCICLPLIKRHIELAQPKVLFLLGHTAISALLNDDSPTKSIRGKWQKISINNKEIEVMPSYHPARLLKQPQLKRDSWQDLLEIKQKISDY